MNRHVLYTIPASCYSGKARAYLRKHWVDYEERAFGDPRYAQEIVPEIGRVIIPVLQTPDGEVIQDTVDIIDHFERDVPPERSAYPQTPLHRVVAHVLEMFGGEGLGRPLMHYRWNFDEYNLAFIREEFSTGLGAGMDPEQRAAIFEWASGAMRKLTVDVGVTPETIPLVEQSYQQFLELMNAHVSDSPYLLGGRPTIADYAFMAPLFAHLSRDPYPSLLMKRTAPRVWRWVERMNSPVQDAGEYLGYPETLFDGDDIPPTLGSLLSYIGEEFVPEMLAQVDHIDGWLAEHDEIQEGDVIPYAAEDRFVAQVPVRWRGTEISCGVLPYRMLLLQRLQDAHGALGLDSQERARDLLREHGLEQLLDARPRRRVIRENNREAWGAAQSPLLATV
ncbi:MAG: glutathione S-transferase family protein [Solirubrobacteraceae bacterium]